MGQADYLVVGDWNARCDRCGKKVKGSTLRQTWNNLYTCAKCWEPRQPQDFVRPVAEDPSVPVHRNPPDILIRPCNFNGMTSYAGYSVAGCWLAEYVSPAFDPAIIY